MDNIQGASDAGVLAPLQHMQCHRGSLAVRCAIPPLRRSATVCDTMHGDAKASARASVLHLLPRGAARWNHLAGRLPRSQVPILPSIGGVDVQGCKCPCSFSIFPPKIWRLRFLGIIGDDVRIHGRYTGHPA